ncbi:MAG: hypothetical protein OXU61_04485 [Gammaproteobacteria bacterium]|nr:hypothetical protein [Gammaproteobacteria bacterium]
MRGGGVTRTPLPAGRRRHCAAPAFFAGARQRRREPAAANRESRAMPEGARVPQRAAGAGRPAVG